MIPAENLDDIKYSGKNLSKTVILGKNLYVIKTCVTASSFNLFFNSDKDLYA